MTSFQSKVAAEWPFRENGAERIDIASVKVGFCHHFEMCFKSHV